MDGVTHVAALDGVVVDLLQLLQHHLVADNLLGHVAFFPDLVVTLRLVAAFVGLKLPKERGIDPQECQFQSVALLALLAFLIALEHLVKGSIPNASCLTRTNKAPFSFLRNTDARVAKRIKRDHKRRTKDHFRINKTHFWIVLKRISSHFKPENERKVLQCTVFQLRSTRHFEVLTLRRCHGATVPRHHECGVCGTVAPWRDYGICPRAAVPTFFSQISSSCFASSTPYCRFNAAVSP